MILRFLTRVKAWLFSSLMQGLDRLSACALACAIPLGRRLTQRRLQAGKPRSLWGVTPILTLPLKARADETLGFSSSSLVYTTYVITSAFHINLSKLVAAAWRIDPRLWMPVHRLILAWALLRYDVFSTFADRGLLPSKERFGINPDELDAWKEAGKNVYIYAYGADVRTRQKTLALGRWNFCVDCPEPTKYCLCDDVAGDRIMGQMAERSTAMIALGDMLTYMPNVHHLSYWPLDISRISPCIASIKSGPLRIAHAPNHTHFKGSHYLEAAIAKLVSEGHSIEYVKVQGVPNHQVIELFSSADIVADQFIGGAYGYTALEALALGKPVLTYVRSADLVVAPDECPFFNVTPDDIEAVLRWLLDNRSLLPNIGKQGRSYVERWHTIEAVGARLGALYLETAKFPETTTVKIAAAIKAEAERRGRTLVLQDWRHPWLLTHAEDIV